MRVNGCESQISNWFKCLSVRSFRYQITRNLSRSCAKGYVWFLSLLSLFACITISALSLTWLRFPTEVELWPKPELGSGTFAGQSEAEIALSENPALVRIQVFGEPRDSSQSIIRFDFGGFDFNIETRDFRPSLSVESGEVTLARFSVNSEVRKKYDFIALISSTQVRFLIKAGNNAVSSLNIYLPKRASKAGVSIFQSVRHGEFGTSSRIRLGGQEEWSKVSNIEQNFGSDEFLKLRFALSAWLIASVSLFIRTALAWPEGTFLPKSKREDLP